MKKVGLSTPTDAADSTPPAANTAKVLDAASQGTTAPGLAQQLAAIYGLPVSASEEDILLHATNLRNRLMQEAADEVKIKAKMDVGLNRQQAMAVIERQRAHDKAMAEARAEHLPVLLDIIRRNQSDLRTARLLVREQFPALDGSEWTDALAEFKKSQPAA